LATNSLWFDGKEENKEKKKQRDGGRLGQAEIYRKKKQNNHGKADVR